jgi:hypothetical protein
MGVTYDDIGRQLATFSRYFIKIEEKTLNLPSKETENKSLILKREFTREI